MPRRGGAGSPTPSQFHIKWSSPHSSSSKVHKSSKRMRTSPPSGTGLPSCASSPSRLCNSHSKSITKCCTCWCVRHVPCQSRNCVQVAESSPPRAAQAQRPGCLCESLERAPHFPAHDRQSLVVCRSHQRRRSSSTSKHATSLRTSRARRSAQLGPKWLGRTRTHGTESVTGAMALSPLMAICTTTHLAM